MKIAGVEQGERGFTVTWDDRSIAEYPYIWLPDNDPDGFHPAAYERFFDLTTVDVDIRPETFSVDRDAFVVIRPADWLPCRTAFDPRSGERHLCGYYLERNEVDSRIRVLDREETTCLWK